MKDNMSFQFIVFLVSFFPEEFWEPSDSSFCAVFFSIKGSCGIADTVFSKNRVDRHTVHDFGVISIRHKPHLISLKDTSFLFWAVSEKI